MFFFLRGLKFPVERATLTGSVRDPYWSKKYDRDQGLCLNWALDFWMGSIELDGDELKPRLNHYHLRFPIRRWLEIAGQKISWSQSLNNEVAPAKLAVFYLWEHTIVPESVIQFCARNGTQFQVEWSGQCDPHWSGDFMADVPFHVEGPVELIEVRVDASERDDDRSVRERLDRFISINDFFQNPIVYSNETYDDGVRMAHSVFTPRRD